MNLSRRIALIFFIAIVVVLAWLSACYLSEQQTLTTAESLSSPAPQASTTIQIDTETDEKTTAYSQSLKTEPQTAQTNQSKPQSVGDNTLVERTAVGQQQEDAQLHSQEPNQRITPLWTENDVISKEGGYQSEWVTPASVLAVVHLPADMLSNFAVGSTFSLPIQEKPEYKIEQQQIYENGDVSWMAVYLDPRQGTNRYGVISDGKELTLMTLYTDEGVYYLSSDDKRKAEVSFVDYPTLKKRKTELDADE